MAANGNDPTEVAEGSIEPGGPSAALGATLTLLAAVRADQSSTQWETPKSADSADATNGQGLLAVGQLSGVESHRAHATWRELEVAIEQHGGRLVYPAADRTCALGIFVLPAEAVAAAEMHVAQLAERADDGRDAWVSIAVHTGEISDDPADLHRGQVARRAIALATLARPGQILVSTSARDLIVDQVKHQFEMSNLGVQQLADFVRPEQVWELIPGSTVQIDSSREFNADMHEVPAADVPPGESSTRSNGARSTARPAQSARWDLGRRARPRLPLFNEPFIGRANELLALGQRVRTERLVTVTGAAGAGKTRLAHQVARELMETTSWRVWWVSLATLTESQAPGALAEILGRPPTPRANSNAPANSHSTARFNVDDADRAMANNDARPTAQNDRMTRRSDAASDWSSISETMARALGSGDGVLVLDNCEHVIGALGGLVLDLLGNNERLRVLMTSREPMGAPGECTWRIAPLGLPPPIASNRSADLQPTDLLRYDSVALFVDRARRARSNFDLSPETAATVAELCRRLEGNPLAIQLAAARCRVLSPANVLDALDNSMRLLRSARPGLLPRDSAVEDSIRWSYDLLTERERSLFRAVSVFVGGWTFEAAEFVGADPQGADPQGANMIAPTGVDGGSNIGDGQSSIDALDRLVKHSFISVADRDGRTRYDLLELVRQFGLERLAEHPEQERQVRSRYRQWAESWVTDINRRLGDADIESVLEYANDERLNFMCAFDQCIESGEVARAAKMSVGMEFMLEVPSWAQVAERVLKAAVRFRSELAEPDQVPVLATMMQLLSAGPSVGQLVECAGDIESLALTRPTDSNIIRSRQLVLLFRSFLGGDVLGDMLANAELTLVDGDPAHIARVWGHVGWVAALHGRVDMFHRVERVLDEQPFDRRAARFAGIRTTQKGMAAFLEGRPADAVVNLLSTINSPLANQGNRLCALAFLGMAAGDCGVDIWRNARLALTEMYEIDGNALAGSTLAAHRCIAALMADDLNAASLDFAVASSLSRGQGLTVGWPHERYTLVAAGVIDGSDGFGATDPAVSVCATARRCLGIAALQGGDFDEAHRSLFDALRIETASGMIRNASFTLDAIARVYVAVSEFEKAADLLGIAHRFRRERGIRQAPCLSRLNYAARQRCIDAVGIDGYLKAYKQSEDVNIRVTLNECMDADR